MLTVGEVQAILDSCDRLRDRFLFAVLHESGVRIGEALGLRLADIAEAERVITVVPRVNANRARSKSRQQRTIPVGAGLMRLYGDYLHGEYATSSRTTCSSTYSPNHAGRRCPIRLSTTWCCGCASAQASTSTRTGSGTAWQPGCCAIGAERGGLEVTRARLGDHHTVDLRAPDRRRRPAGAGGGRLVHRQRGNPVTGSGDASLKSSYGQSPDRRAGLLDKLTVAVRPEFRDDVLIFAPQRPVFGGT